MRMKESFGIRKDGREAFLYTIENETVRLRVSDHGASLVSCVYKPAMTDIVQGGTDVSAYEGVLRYMGGSIGRVCNRIAKGTFELDGHVYHVPVNNGPNALHGGTEGFSDRLWDTEVRDDRVIFRLFSPDGDMRFPGDLEVTVTYALAEYGYSFSYEGKAAADTLFAMTNHAYFNLEGPGSVSVLDHTVQSDAAYYYTVDADGLTVGSRLSVEGTPMDFRQAHTLGERIEEDFEALKNASGYDHHYVLAGSGMRHAAACAGGGIRMDVYTDLPGFHLYTGNFLDGSCVCGKEGGTFPRRSSVCFETQFCPNAQELPDAEAPVLRKGEHCKYTTQYHLSLNGGNHEKN